MKSWLSLKGFTVAVGLVLFCFGVSLRFRGDGRTTAAASYTIGPVTESRVVCVNLREISNPSKFIGCGPTNILSEKEHSVNFAPGPLILRVTKDGNDHYTSSAGIGTTISDATGNVGVNIAITKQVYSDYPTATSYTADDFVIPRGTSSLAVTKRKQQFLVFNE